MGDRDTCIVCFIERLFLVHNQNKLLGGCIYNCPVPYQPGLDFRLPPTLLISWLNLVIATRQSSLLSCNQQTYKRKYNIILTLTKKVPGSHKTQLLYNIGT